MPLQELSFEDWLREARNILNTRGADWLRDNVGEHLDDDEARQVAGLLLREAGSRVDLDAQTQTQRLDLIVELVAYIDTRDRLFADQSDG
jgi:hypothetical protein